MFITITLKHCDSDGRYHVPLARAILRGNPHIYVTGRRSVWLQSSKEHPAIVKFQACNLHELHDAELVKSVALEAQVWLSAEMSRLFQLRADMETLNSGFPTVANDD